MKCEKCGDEHPTEEHYLPKNHEYVIHETYTGFGCCMCGKEENGHKIKKVKQ